MNTISIETLSGSDIEQCKALCNELMAFQQSKAVMAPECFASMNFDTRMKKNYEQAIEKQLIVVKDRGTPVGYIFSTIDMVNENSLHYYPDWAPKHTQEENLGFYPDWLETPQKVGCLNNLYLRDQYRGTQLGSKLFEISRQWLMGFPDCDLAFVYISNGNEAALNFYLNHGFTFSHNVFGGFIKAAYLRKTPP